MLSVGVSPWPLDLRGLSIGEALDDLSRRRLGLQPEEPDANSAADGCEGWADPGGDVRVVTCEGLVALVSLSGAAAFDRMELIGASRAAVTQWIRQAPVQDRITDSL